MALIEADRQPDLPEVLPDVSFVVIGYNESAHIEACLTSIFAQTGLDTYEVIVVDDASTDSTSSVVEALQRVHPKLRLIRHSENRGRGASRRTGQDACVATRIAFIDSDIQLPHDWLSRVVAALEVVDAVSGVAVPDGDVAVIWRMFGPKPKGMISSWDLTGNNVIFRRSALEQVGWPAQRRRAEDNRMARAMVDAGMSVQTLKDLRVEHHEAKTYRRAWAHIYGTGYYATEILRDLRIFRFPDLVWLCWLLTLLGSIGLGAAGVLAWWLTGAVVLLATVAVDVGAMAQRFFFWASPLRWIAATCANFPLMTTYLVARTLAAPRLLMRRQTTVH
jgi:glycosyltransferase involved in cell wall biosynthesis